MTRLGSKTFETSWSKSFVDALYRSETIELRKSPSLGVSSTPSESERDFRIRLQQAAKEARVKLPALETVEEIYEMASEDGNKDLDYAATLTLLEKWAGVQVKVKAA